jgi:hypothetical protein
MKKLVSVKEVEGEGLTALLGENVVLFCMNFYYAGKLTGVNKEDVLLTDPQIVFDLGKPGDKKFAEAEPVPFDLYVRISAIEAYCKSGR